MNALAEMKKDLEEIYFPQNSDNGEGEGDEDSSV